MKTKTQFPNRILSLMLSIMMVVSMLPMNGLTASAAEGDVASVTTAEGTQTYADLASAFAAAAQAENAVLTLLADITISSTVYVEGGKFTVDLNGKTWTANNRALGILGADILITDSTADGLGKIVGTTVNSTIMIGNGTKLEVAGGTVENTRDGRCIDTQYNGHPTDAQFTLSGGKLITAGWSAIHVDCTSVTIKNGEIKSQGDAYYHGDDHDYRSGLLDFSQHPDPTGIAVINYASVEIIPGDTTIKLPAGYCFYEQDANQPVTALPADMTNGYIIGKAPVCTCEEQCSIHATNSACTICSVDIAFCTGGMQAQAKIGDTYYTTLVEAAAKVTEGDTIDVLTDVTIGADETVTFAAFTHLNVAQGKAITCSGTVKIGDQRGILFENQLYYHGGEVSESGISLLGSDLRQTYYTAGDGYACFVPASGEAPAVIRLHNATVRGGDNDSATSVTSEGIYYGPIQSSDLIVQFSGENTVAGRTGYDGSRGIYAKQALVLEGEEGAVLHVAAGRAQSSSCGITAQNVTITGGTVNVATGTLDSGAPATAIGASKLTVSSNATLNMLHGDALNGAMISAEEIEGSFDALVVQFDTEQETGALVFTYCVYGNMAVKQDTTLLFDASVHMGFAVPEGSRLTVNAGKTLDLSEWTAEYIDFSGTVINDGTILLPEDFALDNAPKSGTVKLGERGYTWDPETGNWRCSDEAGHPGCDSEGNCTDCGLALVQASVDQMVLRPGAAGIYFTGSFYIDPSVSAKRYGIALSLVSQQPKADGTDFFSLWTQGSTSVLVTNILDGEADDGKNAEMVIYARPYVLLEDGTYFYGQVQQASLREVVTAADARWNELTDVQKDAFRTMYTTFRATMEPWALPNLKENLA